MSSPWRPRRYRTDSPELDQHIIELLEASGAPVAHWDHLFEILVTAVGLGGDDVDRLDLKITNAAMREMRKAFAVFAPYRSIPKATIFGSARALPEDPLYVQARELASLLAAEGWMVVTGGGPGIMAAGMEGAGRDRSFAVNIRLPFEQANPFLAGDPKQVEMKYFFTRKLMLLKESAGFVTLPGGFGTLDEALELLTLVQTGKAEPSPIVLLDVAGGTYWEALERFMAAEVAARGFIGAEDQSLYRRTDDAREAAQEILGFYRNYHSRRFVGDLLVLRLRSAPSEGERRGLSEEFADICTEGGLEASGPLDPELADGDHLDLARLVLRFDRAGHGRLRQLIDRLNRLSSAPPGPSMPRT
ncbi:MAG: TIGR00730 family Rossman fold protein [Actinomycetota bacterium]|nr:TIGR00730 family Rossman fold protein [Actinomycetota bacterium]MDQ3574718.1 TIGR00730 family Rossman fold protein [Actinomycetota bacterium]